MNQYLISIAIGVALAIAVWFWHELDVSVRSDAAVKSAIAQRDAADRAAVLADNKQTRDRETATFKKREIDEQNRAAQADRLASLESGIADRDRKLRDTALAAGRDQRQATNASPACGPAPDPTVPLELFADAAGEASRLAKEAGRLAAQASGLQQYGQACFQLTNPRDESPPYRHDVEEKAPGKAGTP